MSREIRRVPLDFRFPPGKTWDGYVNPHYRERRSCPRCDGDGSSLAGRLLNDLWYLSLYGERVPREIVAGRACRPRLPTELLVFADRVVESGTPWVDAIEQEDVDALVEADRLWDFTRRPITDEQREVVAAKVAAGGNSWLPDDNGYRPTPAEVNAWSRNGFGHDSFNAWVCQKARAERYGVGTSCPDCRGRGYTPAAAVARRIRAWKKSEPPAGPGWQLWQTVSEGGPVSPVFPSPEGLAQWMANGGDLARVTYAEALSWITGPGWAPTMIGGPGGVVDGVTAMCREATR